MPKIYHCHVTRSEINNLKVLNNNTLAYNTSLHGTVLIDIKECNTIKNITFKNLNHKVTAHTFSPNSQMFAYSNQKAIYVVNIQTKELIQTIHTNNEKIQILSFDTTSTYIIAGTANGRVLQYRFNKKSLLARLCSFPHNRSSIYVNLEENENFVSAFAFYKNTLACSGFGNTIFILDLNSDKDREVITLHHTRIDALCFCNKNTLISGHSDGVINISSLDNLKTCKTINTPLSKIKQILVMPNPDFIMAIGITNIITIIDIKNIKIIHSKYIEFDENISYIDFTEDESLVVALKNKKIVTVELPSKEKLKSLILTNSLEEAYKLISKEPMLKDSIEHKELEKKFHDDYLYATHALINQNKTEATKVLLKYKKIKSKQKDIQILFASFDNFRRFHTLFLEKNYALAYAMASRFPPLKETAQYKKMEQIFKIAFANAQRHVMQDSLQSARALLAVYNSVASKKPIIRLVLTQNKEFTQFLSAISKKDFLLVEKLINTNELFAQIPSYIALKKELNEKLQNIKFSIKSGEIDIALKLLNSIKSIESIDKQVQALYLDCKSAVLLKKAYDNNSFKSCYEILDTHKSLRLTELGLLLENHWTKIINKCEEFALKGNLKDIKKTLGELIKLETRRSKIGNLLRVSFHVQIKHLIQAKNFKGAESIIYKYMDTFGIDSEINQLMQGFTRYSKMELAITDYQIQRPSRDSWIHSDIIK